MKTEHTPGPWSYYAGESQPNPYWRNIRLYNGERLIAEVGCTNAVGDGDANARLIAAAPELLAALSAYQRLVGYLQRTTNPEEWATHGDWKRLQAEADAAIRKAKGDA